MSTLPLVPVLRSVREQSRGIRYPRSSLKTMLGITAEKKRLKRELGITAVEKPFRWWGNEKRDVKRRLGYYSPFICTLFAI